MKYVREHINEKFTQDSDPIKDMNIGLTSFQMEVDVRLSFWNRKEIHPSQQWILRPLEKFNIQYEIIKPGSPSHHTFPFIRFTGKMENLIDFVMDSRLMAPYTRTTVKKTNPYLIWGYNREETAQFIKNHKLNEKFTQDSDPIKDMNIGDPEKALFPLLKKELEPFSIYISWQNEGDDCWKFYIDFNQDVIADYDERTDYVDLLYFSDDESAKEYTELYYEEISDDDYFKVGFNLLYDLNNYILPTSDYKKIVRALLKINYGTSSQIKTKIQELQNKIDLYKKILSKR